METKFQVGQVWKTRDDREATITEILVAHEGLTYPVIGRIGDGGESWKIDGTWYESGENSGDLIELVMNADGTPAGTPELIQGEKHASVTNIIHGEPLLQPSDPRTEFIDKLAHDLFHFAHREQMGTEMPAEYLRAAVTLRDELLAPAQ